MDSTKIRLGRTDSVNSTDRANYLDVELRNTSKMIHFTDIKTTVDKLEQFKKERNSGTKYRLITTINPYCSNVLFNPFTEMVYAEGSVPYKDGTTDFKGCDGVVDGESFFDGKESGSGRTDKPSMIIKKSVYSDNEKPNRIEMIMNTEYSRPGCAYDSYDINGNVITGENYVYHPGYDIFDNHILRNNSFKIVNFSKAKLSANEKSLFNTIADKMRYADGKIVQYRRREEFSDDGNGESQVSKGRDKHLYNHGDITEFGNGDAINAALYEEDGWYGFINRSTIQSNSFRQIGANVKPTVLNIGYVMNDRKPCEFVDMYPDRTLYSFNPKYNRYQHREEYNWEVILTYPYRHTNDYLVVEPINVITGTRKEGEETVEITEERSGLMILSAVKTTAPNGETVVLFRSLTKHGLKGGDTIRFYYRKRNTEGNWKQYEKNFVVRNTGDLKNNGKDFYFYINDLDFIRLLNENYNNTDSELNTDNVDDNDYRFSRVVGNVTSKYYIRVFRKLPNFKYATSKFPDDGSKTIEEYIEENSKYPDDFIDEEKRGKTVLFDKEQYKLAFESTIYSDASTQVTFTDSINIENLKDDRGFPLTELYVTVIKTNYGHEKWYGITEEGLNPDRIIRNDKDIEFSHCFGKVSEGLQFSQTNIDLSDEYIRDIRQSCGDISMIYNNYNYKYKEEGTDKVRAEYSSPYGTDITVNDDEFLGDIVEYNQNECIEKIIQPFMHRFNTAQRELNDERKFRWRELYTDDFDKNPDNTDNLINGFEVDDSKCSFSVKEEAADTDIISPTSRSEGYYYQPHYRIALREFGTILQDQNKDIILSSITPVQSNSIYLKLTTVRRSGVNIGDIVYMYNRKNDDRYSFTVTYIESPVSFYIIPYMDSDNPWHELFEKCKMNWLDICNLSLPKEEGEQSQIFFRIKNNEIPEYAEKVGSNKYLWREVLNPGDDNTVNLPEYAYSNGTFYITNEINFFMRRQDPHGWNGLLCKGSFPNDISGNISRESNYVYKDEREKVC